MRVKLDDELRKAFEHLEAAAKDASVVTITYEVKGSGVPVALMVNSQALRSPGSSSERPTLDWVASVLCDGRAGSTYQLVGLADQVAMFRFIEDAAHELRWEVGVG